MLNKAGCGFTDADVKAGRGPGFSTCPVIELHGSWLDSKANPVIKMSGSLRGDLYQQMLDCEETGDFCLSIGSSLSGLNCDRVPVTIAKRHKQQKKGLGSVCVALQRNPYDDETTWAIRVFDFTDHFMGLVAKALQEKGLIDAVDFVTDYEYGTGKVVANPRAPAGGELEFDGKKLSKFGAKPPAASASTSAAKSPARVPATGAKSPAQRSPSTSPGLPIYPATAHKSPSQPLTSFKSPPLKPRPSATSPSSATSSSAK